MRTLAFLCLLAVANLAAAQTPAPDAFAQNKALGRGVNILGYDPIWRSRDQARFQEKHFRLLHEAGFGCVRINLHPFRHMGPGPDHILPDKWFTTLDWAVTNAQRHGLKVLLDLHEYNAMGTDPAANREKFLAVWRQLSAHYQAASADVLFEILNEPSGKLTPELWNEYLRAALAIIREKNPHRTVVAGPAFWNSIKSLDKLELPADDRNLIVTVHYYLPMEFTHQGASWANFKDKRDVQWLGTDAERQALAADFDRAADWAKKNNRPLFLGEFGAYDKGPMESRARYTAAVARAAEARGWSWAYWQFDSDFILYDIPRDAWVEPIRNALVPARAN